MINSYLKDGKHFEKRKDKPEDVKLISAQNRKYLNWRRDVNAKKMAKLQSSLHFIDVEDKPKNKHTYFVEDKSQFQNLEQKFENLSHLSDRSYNLPLVDDLKTTKIKPIDNASIREIAREKIKSYSELNKRVKRENKLKSMLETYSASPMVYKNR